jgi:hypothetical protein
VATGGLRKNAFEGNVLDFWVKGENSLLLKTDHENKCICMVPR